MASDPKAGAKPIGKKTAAPGLIAKILLPAKGTGKDDEKRKKELEKELAKKTAVRKPYVKGKRDPEKAAEKQKKVLSDKETREKRIASLKSFFEVTSDEDQAVFFENNAAVMFSLILETLQPSKKEKKQQKTEDIVPLLDVVRRFIQLKTARVTSPASPSSHSKEIERVLERCLHPANKHLLRVEGLDLLLYILSLKPPAVVLGPFRSTESWKAKIEALDAPVTNATMPSMMDALLLFEHLLNFMADSELAADHKYWFKLLLDNYLAVFYPDVCVPEGKPGPQHTEVFRTCPAEIQNLLLAHLDHWSSFRSPLFQDLWEAFDGALVMEISRQTCLLPLEWVDTIKDAINLTRQWISLRVTGLTPPNDTPARLWKKYARNLSLTLTQLEPAEEHNTTHVELVKTVVGVFGSLAADRAIEDAVRQALLLILLEAYTELLTRGAQSKGPRASLAINLCTFLSQALLREWLLSRNESAELWDPLGDALFKLTDWRDLVQVWRDRVKELTSILIEQIYTPERDAGDPQPAVTAAAIKRELRASVTDKKTSTFKDPKLLSVPWGKETIYFGWTHIFNILGDFNRFRNAENYELAMQTLSETVDQLYEAQEQLPWDVEKPIPLMETWLTGLLEATYLDPRFVKGKVYAYRILHKFFCQNESPVALETLSHFYRVLLKAVGPDSPQAEVNEVVLCAAQCHLFSLALPGSFVLIVPYIRAIERMFAKATEPEPVLAAALSVVQAFICFPDHFAGLAYPTMENTADEGRATGEQLRALIASLQLGLLKQTSSASLKISALWGICVTVFEDMICGARERTEAELLSAVLAATSDEHEAVARAALEVLSVLALQTQRPIKKSLAYTVSNRLLENANDLLTRASTPAHETILANHFYVLADFLLSPNHLMEEDPHFITRVFKSISVALNDVAPRLAKRTATNSTPPPSALTVTSPGGDTAAPSTPAKAVVPPKEDMHPMRDAAEALLTALVNRYNNFPCPAGPDQMNSPVPPADDQETVLYFLYNDTSLISLYETKPTAAGGERTAVVTIRDSSGRYTWNATLHYEDIGRSRRPALPAKLEKTSSTQDSSVDEEDGKEEVKDKKHRSGGRGKKASDERETGVDTPPTPGKVTRGSSATAVDEEEDSATPNSNTARSRKLKDRFKGLKDAPRLAREKGQIPKQAEGETYGNMLDELLGYISEVYPECLTEAELRERLVPVPTADDKLAAFIAELRDQTELEDKRATDLRKSKTRVVDLTPMVAFPREEPPTSFHLCRLLLSHLGYLTQDNLKRFRPIENGTKFQRHLHLIDKTSSRETIKFGLIYVAEGQEHQYEIFRNSDASKLYREFAAGLGWLVDLRTHQGFSGGLVPAAVVDPKDPLFGNTAYFYSDRNYELICHEVVRMPTDPKDPHQLEKKKHIGNDIVNIIWTEHKRDYKPTTITSQFNFAHIIIYPLPNGLFRIQIFRKEKVELFGPLLDGMVVTKAVLPLLVRQTAINANRAVRYNQPGYERPYPTRKALLGQIERFKQDLDFKDFFSNLFVPAAPDQAPKEIPSTPGGRPASPEPVTKGAH